MPRHRFLTLSLLALAAAAPARAQQPQSQPQSTPQLMPALDVADIDTTCKPCSNFYRYATGGWAKRTQIPAAFSSWSGFNELNERNNAVVRNLLETAARESETTKNPDRRRIGRMYASCMDSTLAEAQGAKPIAADLKRIDAIRTRAQLRDEIVRMHNEGMNVIFGSGATTDQKNSSRTIFAAGQGGLGLPDRDFYFKSDTQATRMRADYVDHMTAMFGLLGQPAARARACASPACRS